MTTPHWAELWPDLTNMIPLLPRGSHPMTERSLSSDNFINNALNYRKLCSIFACLLFYFKGNYGQLII